MNQIEAIKWGIGHNSAKFVAFTNQYELFEDQIFDNFSIYNMILPYLYSTISFNLRDLS